MSDETYTTPEIARKTGLTNRAIRYYTSFGLLPPPESRGVGTRYTREHLVRLRAITYLRKTERMRLEKIRQRFQGMTLADIEALLPPPPAPAPVATPAAAVPAPAAGPELGFVRWDHLELVPGLELRVRGDAGPLLWRLAREIHAAYGAKAEASVG